MIATLNRSDYAETTKRTMRGTGKKFYSLENGGRDHPAKVDFISLTKKKQTKVTRDDLLTGAERQRSFRAFSNTRARAFAMVPTSPLLALVNCSPGTSGISRRPRRAISSSSKGARHPDRTNQLVCAGRTVREWFAQHPCGGELGNVQDVGPALGQDRTASLPTLWRDPASAWGVFRVRAAARGPVKSDGFRRRFNGRVSKRTSPSTSAGRTTCGTPG